MRNADNNHDPRGWGQRPSPAGFRRGHRPARPARSGHTSPPTHRCRHAAPVRSLPFHAAVALTFQRGFSFVPPAPPASVPGPAGLVSALLTAAQEHFAASHFAAADAFLKLVPLPAAHPRTTWQQLGHLHFALAEYEAAGRAYGYAAAYAPRDASLQVRLAHTCLRLADLPSFERYLQRALALDPESAPALQLLADLNRDESRYDEAAGYYHRLLQAAPGHYDNLLSLALCHSCLGESEAARDCLQRARQAVRGFSFPSHA